MLEYINLIWIVSSIIFGMAGVAFWFILAHVLYRFKVTDCFYIPFTFVLVFGHLALTFILIFAPYNHFYRNL